MVLGTIGAGYNWYLTEQRNKELAKQQDFLKSFPPISRPLVERLDRLFPHKCPDKDTPDREIWIYSGKREVIDFLLRVLNFQEKGDDEQDESAGSIMEADFLRGGSG
jgi:hypothetical protein